MLGFPWELLPPFSFQHRYSSRVLGQALCLVQEGGREQEPALVLRQTLRSLGEQLGLIWVGLSLQPCRSVKPGPGFRLQ